jgi:hypothetical protein
MRVVLVVKNIAYCMGTANPAYTRILDEFVYGLASALDVDIDSLEITERGQAYSSGQYDGVFSYDSASFPVHIGIVLLSIILFFILLLLKRKVYRREQLCFAIAAICSLLFVAISVAWCTSVSRYLFSPLLILLPVVPMVIDAITKRTKVIFLCVLVIAVLAGARPLLCNSSQPILPVTYNSEIGRAIHANVWVPSPFSEPRDRVRSSSTAFIYYELTPTLMQMIRSLDLTKVALYQDGSEGLYNFLYALRDDKYEVRYIDAAYLSHKEVPNYIPDCFINSVVYLAEDGRDYMPIEYHGAVYKPVYGYYASYMNEDIVFYVKSDLIPDDYIFPASEVVDVR